jgi:hypothetical protein
VDTHGLPVHLALRPAKRTITGYVRFSSAPCCPKRCCWRIAVMMPIGSGSLLASREHGRTFRRNEIAKTRSASARICIVHATWSKGSSTKSSNVGVVQLDTTNSQPTIWRSLNSHQSEFGYALMSPRPSTLSKLNRSGLYLAIFENGGSLNYCRWRPTKLFADYKRRLTGSRQFPQAVVIFWGPSARGEHSQRLGFLWDE